MGKKVFENVKGDDGGEFETLLGEIPLATSNNLMHPYHRHHRHGDDGHDHGHGSYVSHGMCGFSSSPVSGFSLQSDGSSSSLFSGGYPLSDTGSPTPPPFEDLKSTIWLDSMVPDSAAVARGTKASDSFVDELGLCANLSKMYIGNHQQENPNGLSFRDFASSGNNTVNVHHKHGGDCNGLWRGFFDSGGFQSPFHGSPIGHGPHVAEMNSALLGLNQDYKMANLFGSQQCPGWHDSNPSRLNGFSSGSMDSPRHRRQLINGSYGRGNLGPELAVSLSRNLMVDDSFYAQKYGMSVMEERGMSRSPNYSICTNLRPNVSVQDLLQHSHHPMSNAGGIPLRNARVPQGNLNAITSEGSFILQGEGLSYVVRRGSDRASCQSAVHETGFAKHRRRSELDIRHHQVLGSYENPRSPRIGSPFPLLPKYNSLSEARGSIYLIAKDQNGCRFLQRMFEEGTREDVHMIFNEIIDHVVELMMNPFGNYLMQKLLDVCNEEQRMHIILMVTSEPGQLVRISLNSHGTRVVQKLIETLRTRREISAVISALEPGFLALIKDLNGNHVVQHCLQCLSNEDNKFIFIAAAKYCVEIATHQHGCCVLQRCIGHSSGEYKAKLVAEISSNALLLAHDQYGNYAVQFILDTGIDAATEAISRQFQGNYVHMSMQKFSSHVVEKCLAVFKGENRSRIICELLSAPRFEQLLQDPHANYVVQSALRHSEGHVHNKLVEEVESHKAMARNSPYSKKIFSQKLLKK